MIHERPWHPESWTEFKAAYDDGRARVVVFPRARDWAKKQGWSLRAGLFGSFRHAIVQRITGDEDAFWSAYRAGAVDFWILDREPSEMDAAKEAVKRRAGAQR